MMVNSGVMRHRVLGIKNSDKYVILTSTLDNPRLLMEDLINAIGRLSRNITSNIVELRYYIWN